MITNLLLCNKTLFRLIFTQLQCFALYAASIMEETYALSYLDYDVLRPKHRLAIFEMQDRPFMFKLLLLVLGVVPVALLQI